MVNHMTPGERNHLRNAAGDLVAQLRSRERGEPGYIRDLMGRQGPVTNLAAAEAAAALFYEEDLTAIGHYMCWLAEEEGGEICLIADAWPEDGASMAEQPCVLLVVKS